jgi:glycosyltransferase involved in cell wall biosynthesis
MTVHEYSPVFNGVGAAVLSRMTGVPYVLEIMHVTGVPHPSGIWELLNRFLFRQFIRYEARPARAVRVINRHGTPDFLVAAGVERSKIVYAPAFYIDLDTFRPTGAVKLYDVVFVGRMSRNKGVELFLDVLEKTGCIGVAVGEGPLLSWVRHEAKKRGLKLHTPGFAKDGAEVARYINESRLLLMPSLSEGGPRVVLEAMACGVPVVATPVGIVPDVLPPECIEEWDAGDLADKVRNILQDESLYQRLSQQGLMTVRGFEKTKSIHEYAQTLQRIAGNQ